MSKGEFKKYIESIGFKFDDISYYRPFDIYKHILDHKFSIRIFVSHYDLYDHDWIGMYEFNNLSPIKRISRSIKLKKILG